MIIGDRNAFGVEISPVIPSWRAESSAERGPWALFAIWVKGRNLTANILPGTDEVVPGVYVPLAPIADWLVRNAQFIAFEESAAQLSTDANLVASAERWTATPPPHNFDEAEWDDRRFEWSSRHFLHAADDGQWLPNVAFVQIDDRLWISWGPSRFSNEYAPAFIELTGMENVPWQFAVNVFARFVDIVAREVRSRALVEPFPWGREDGSFVSATQLTWSKFIEVAIPSQRRVFDVFDVANVSQLMTALKLPDDASPLDSVALRSMRDLDAERALREPLIECEVRTRESASNQLARARDLFVGAMTEVSPEDQGYEAARGLRQHLEMDDRPIGNLRALLQERFGIALKYEAVTSTNHGVAGGHVGGSGLVIVLRSPHTKKTWAARMEAVRGVGHLLLDAPTKAGIIGSGSSKKASGPRRRRSGTFAAELLLPRSAMIARTGGVLDAALDERVFLPLLEDYGVGATTAAWQFWNAGLLSSQDAVEQLITSYGSKSPRVRLS